MHTLRTLVAGKAEFETTYNEDGTLAAPGTGMKIGRLTRDALLNALLRNPKHGGGRYTEPTLGISNGTVTIVAFEGRLNARFFKQGGYTPWYAQVTLEEAKGLLDDTYTLKYIKSSNRYVVAPK